MSSSSTSDPIPATGSTPPADGARVDCPFPVGQTVRLAQRPPYLKTADPMPMLRPPDLIDAEESGVVVELRSQDQRAVRFRRGTFLLTTSQLRSGDATGLPNAGDQR